MINIRVRPDLSKRDKSKAKKLLNRMLGFFSPDDSFSDGEFASINLSPDAVRSVILKNFSKKEGEGLLEFQDG